MPPPYAANPPPTDALAWFRAKGLKVGFDYRDVWREEHAVAFTVAKIMQLDLLADVRAEVDRALAEGLTFRDFEKQITPLLQEKGWWGIKEMTDPVTGEAREVQLGSPRRLRTIYDTNLRTARAAGQWERIQKTKDSLPYLLYTVGPSREHRPEHLGWHGTLLPVDHPFWKTHFTPNGWNSLPPWEGINGKVMIGLKARYSGPLVEIIGESGNRLSITSYHPVLTDKGWMPAGDLHEGCNLLRYRFDMDKRCIAADSNDNQSPTRADEVFNALLASGFCTMPRAALNLYGDIEFIERDVDVVGANRELLNWLKAEALQFREQINLMSSYKQKAVASGFSCSFFNLMKRFFRDQFGLLAGFPHALTQACFSLTPYQHGAFIEFDPLLFQMERQRFSTDIELIGQLAQRYPRQIQFNQIIWDWLSGSSGGWLPPSVIPLIQELLAMVSHGNHALPKVSAYRRSSNLKSQADLFQGLPASIGLCSLFNSALRQNLDMPWAVSGGRPFAARHLERDYFAAGPYRNARIFDVPSDCGGSNPQAHCDVSEAHPGLIEIDRIKQIRIRQFSGHVYDFQTNNGLIISFGGYCVSNCKCRIRQVSHWEYDRLLKTGIPAPASEATQEIDPKTGLPTGRHTGARVPVSTVAPKTELVEWTNKRTGEVQQIPKGIDPGWDYNPGEGRLAHLEKVLAEKEQQLKITQLKTSPKIRSDILNTGDTNAVEAAKALVQAITAPQWPQNKLQAHGKMTQKTLSALQAYSATPEVQNFLAELVQHNYHVNSRDWHYFKYKYEYNDLIASPDELDHRFLAVVTDPLAEIHPKTGRLVVYSNREQRLAVIALDGQRITVYRPDPADVIALAGGSVWEIQDLID